MTIAWECHACGQVSATGRICCGAYMGRVEIDLRTDEQIVQDACEEFCETHGIVDIDEAHPDVRADLDQFIADLRADLARVEGLEGYTLDELVVLVGPAWGYDVSREGIVALAD